MHLARANWPNLLELDLCTYLLTKGENSINDEGCSYLAKGKWPLLKKLALCKKLLNKLAIGSAIRDASSS